MAEAQKRNEPDTRAAKKGNRANMIDLFIFIILILILSNNESLSAFVRIGLLVFYPFVFIPVSMMLGGSPGQRLLGFKLRKKDNHERFISLINAYKRFGLVLFDYTIGIGGKKPMDKILEHDDKTNTALIDIETELDEETRKRREKQKAKVNFGIAAIIYIAWVIWLGNYWFILGLPVIFDIYISRKVNWTPWKKREGPNHWAIEWLDALIFAVVAVTIINIFLFQNYKIPTGSMEKSLLIGDHLYVSKVSYGPRIPQTPLSIPFMHHTIPGTTTKSYLEWIKLDYKRLKGFTRIKRDDPVVFNFPAGDTVIREPEYQSLSYYYWVRNEGDRLKELDMYTKKPVKTSDEYYLQGREKIWEKHELLVRPVDRRDNYIKRCVAIAGDSLEIIQGDVYVNGTKQKMIDGLQYTYLVQTDGRRLNDKRLEKIGISKSDIKYSMGFSTLEVPLTNAMAEELKKNTLIKAINRYIQQPEYSDGKMFPHDERYPWNLDNYGPIYIPEKGVTIDINLENLPLYERIIGHYEGNDLEVRDSIIYINSEPSETYTFQMDYYWMMGDNRHSSLDSRYWGYVPEDHIVGKPKFVWLSLDKDKSFPANIRLKRMFMGIK